MKTQKEIEEVIKKGIDEDLDIDIFAVRKGDGFRWNVCCVLGDTDTIGSYINEMEKEVTSLINSKWEIDGFEFEIS